MGWKRTTPGSARRRERPAGAGPVGAPNSRIARAHRTEQQPVALFFDSGRVVAAAVTVLLAGECVVRSASNASQAVREIVAAIPDVAVLRLGENPLEAVWLAGQIRTRAPRCRLVTIVESPSAERAPVISTIGGDALLAGPLSIARLLEQLRTFLGDASEDAGTRLLHEYVARAIGHVIAHYDDNLTAGSVAHAVGLSKSRLACVFRADVGMTLKTYLVQLRLEVARRFLVETEDKLETIANAVGFCDGPHLSRCFRKYFGHPPSRYRPALRDRRTGWLKPVLGRSDGAP